MVVQSVSGGTKRATSVNMPLLRLQSSEWKFIMSREIEPVRRSFCRHGSCTFTGVALLVPSGCNTHGLAFPRTMMLELLSQQQVTVSRLVVRGGGNRHRLNNLA